MWQEIHRNYTGRVNSSEAHVNARGRVNSSEAHLKAQSVLIDQFIVGPIYDPLFQGIEIFL